MSYPLLERINAPGEIKNLPASDMPALCEEIRQFLIKSVSETGGHLSSNLGVVELTVALHRVLDFPQDKLLFDVGHQCYTHKLLTGRREGFAQLRRKNGISGFPSPRESDCDAFIAGHGSAALSTAIGIARAKKLKNEPGKVVVIVGDGAFTGGMVYEGMNNVSKLNNLIVILNDNKMSISKNVGQMANYLTKLRTDPKYSHVKAHMETTLERIPVAGDALVRVLQGGKQLIRRGIYKSTMFEEMGFQYIGPIDGHDVGMLTHTLTNLRGEQYAPVFLHVVTKKGRGLKPAEENPGEFHAVSSIDLNHLTDPELSPKDSFSSTFGCALADLGDDEPRLCGITAAMKYGSSENSELTGGKVIFDESTAAASLKYGAFIMGDNPFTVIENPEVSNGQSCIVVKESFGNAFIPFLVDHYQTVYVVDYRYYGGSVSALAKAKGVTDVLFVNNLSAIRGSYQMGKLAGVK